MSDIESGVVEETQQFVEEVPASDGDNYQTEEVYDETQEDNSSYQSEMQDDTSERLRNQQSIIDEQKRIIEILRDSPQNIQQNQPQEPQQPDYDPEDLATLGNVEQIISKKMNEMNQMQVQRDSQMQVQTAKAKYSDYDEVANLGMAYVNSQPNPEAFAKGILDSGNSAEMLYSLGKLHPNYKPAKKQDVVGKVKQNLNRPNTLNQTSGGQPSTEKDWSKAPKAEVEAEFRKLLGFNV